MSEVGYDYFLLEGVITISSVLQLTAELNKYLNTQHKKDLVLELSKVETIDSSGSRLLLNLKNRMTGQKTQLFILSPSDNVKTILAQNEEFKDLSIIDSVEILEKRASANFFEMVRPYTKQENDLLQVNANCPICGSPEVVGYLTDQNNYDWRWIDDEPFPVAHKPGTNKVIDYFSLLPVVCLECYMASIRISDFNILDGSNAVILKSKMGGEGKNLLTKSIKKRKKMAESELAADTSGFFHPRSRIAMKVAYELAEFCDRTLSIQKNGITPFNVGYLNYLSILYTEQNRKQEYVSNCRTWFNQALSREEDLTTIERAICYFVLLVANINLLKIKEATVTYNEYLKMVENLPSGTSSATITSPNFWFTQAERLWKKQIHKQSVSLTDSEQ